MIKGNGIVFNTLNLSNIDYEIISLIEKIKIKEIYYSDIPEEYREHPLILEATKKYGLRKVIKKGWDVIRQVFFVEELLVEKWCNNEIQKNYIKPFRDFESYYLYLQGDVYENACYYQYFFSESEIEKYSIDTNKITNHSLIPENIEEFLVRSLQEELKEYGEVEKQKQVVKEGLKKLYRCRSYNGIKKFLEQCGENNSLKSYPTEFFLYNFIFKDKEKAFNVIMEYVNRTYSFNFVKSLCLIYDPEKVFESYNSKTYSLTTAKRHKKSLRLFIDDLKNKKIRFHSRSYFDEMTHYYVCEQAGRTDKDIFASVVARKFFETFEEMAIFLNNNLSHCNLSKAVLPNVDFSKYKISEFTKLPFGCNTNLSYSVIKKYDRLKDCFVVEQSWLNVYGKIIKQYIHEFKYFFDFAYFLKNDLSNADLLFCDGLQNICNLSELNLKNARLTSNIYDKLGYRYEGVFDNEITSFSLLQTNENESIKEFLLERNSFDFEQSLNQKKIYYISDLHLLHRLNNAHCRSFDDAVYVIQKLIDKLLENVSKYGENIILIGGDTASNFSLFKLFVKQLRVTLDEYRSDIQVVFILGNHELWDFAEFSFDEIVEKYKNVLTKNRMYLLQNNLIFKDCREGIKIIDESQLKRISKEQLVEQLKYARLIFFGGLAFAGRNADFNANQMIYRNTIDRRQEIEKSREFENLYEKICEYLTYKKVVVFTHMPKKDWCANDVCHKGFVYVSGHSHKNHFYDDGDYRIYADNQIGYNQENARLKYFYLENDCDIFEDYSDGIYEIQREDYLNFYHGKNISITFNKDFYKLQMLKKNGYYMFVLQYPNGNLCILNGGAEKGLAYRDINYYFKHIDSVIARIKLPFDKFFKYQQEISKKIKSIGGSGDIHGAIIDIDFFNHIYINPIDLTVTAYWASDIVNKIVFKDIPTLLSNNCPSIYSQYLKMIEGDFAVGFTTNDSAIAEKTLPYFSTDIYAASREIKKMQKLNSNILSVWLDDDIKKLS